MSGSNSFVALGVLMIGTWAGGRLGIGGLDRE